MLKGQEASIKMRANNIKKYMDWEIKVQLTYSNGQKWQDTISGIGFVEPIGDNLNETLRECKDVLEQKIYSEFDHIYPGMEAKIISCKVKYIPFSNARKRAERLFKEGKLEKEIAEHFGLNLKYLDNQVD
ncbi:MAG: hypothetical protein BWY15_00712 [Firmicutes bacterium ADurb.Bin193]|nr:MAG: hypothetical protein BWY15_00712 [Firmicutes bacterium ADurb.Bin193]